ncbi:MAG: MoxR family ATPase [Fimbriimonadaceae bacterium]|nr:MoxR family ATPase [Fimbriimonadaceae bacterium]
MQNAHVRQLGQAIQAQINRVILGKEELVEQAVLALICGGHVLIEDVPGVGKTTLAKAIARAIGGDYRRIQFTPDLLPTDITGTSVFVQKSGEFEFRPGPLFANVVLVDEVNRATPKTQSALLEAMEERQVSADGITHILARPFFVLATQNNIEMTGTYPLPEAQLDRFFGRVSLGYPSREAETMVLANQQSVHPVDSVQPVGSLQEIIAAQDQVREIHVDGSIREYVVDIVRATREDSQLVLGSSPRGSLHLLHAAQARAALQGMDYVRPDHVKYSAPFVLGHRIILRGEVRARGITGEEIIRRMLDTVPAPVPAA